MAKTPPKDPKKPKKKMTEKQLANLRPAPPWKPGQSGNPDGKPAGTKNRATILNEMLALGLKKKDVNGKWTDVEHPLDPSQKTITVEGAINAALINRALKGSERATEIILDSVYGKIKETKVLENPDGSALEMKSGMTPAEASKVYMDLIAEAKKGIKK